MLEIKVSVELPGIPEALNNLAHALMNQAVGHVNLDKPAVAEALEENRKVIQTPKNEEAPVSPMDEEAIVAMTEPKPEQKPKRTKKSEAKSEAKPEPKPEQKPEPEQSYTFDQISRAGADLCSKGRIGDLTALLNTKYGIQAITQLNPDQYASVVEDLTALGAQF